jgi:hypothetical protein
MELNKITYGQYNGMGVYDRKPYDAVIEALVPKGRELAAKIGDEFYYLAPKVQTLWELSFSEVVELRTAVSELAGDGLMSEIARIMYGATDLKCIELFSLKNLAWVIEALAELDAIEAAEFAGSDPGVDMSGLERFGQLPAIDSIAGGDVLKYAEVLKLNYGKVFQHVCLQHELSKIRLEMQKRQTKQ